MLARPSSDPDSSSTRSRILDAALRIGEAAGLNKLSMNEVAQRGRVGRATVYLYFSGRDALIQAVVERELGRFFDSIEAAIDATESTEQRLVQGFGEAYRWLRRHKALQATLRLNPEALRSYVITEDSAALRLAREFVESMLRDDTVIAALRPQFAEHIARIIHSLVLVPGGVVNIDAPDGPEHYARTFLVPVLRSLTRTDDLQSLAP